MNIDNETKFEQHIEAVLLASPLYIKRNPKDFDIKRRVDADMLYQFLRSQTDTWARMIKRFKSDDAALDAVIKDYNSKLDNGHSLVDILRKGLKIQGIPVKLMQTKPTLAGEDSALHELYLANRFAVVRQMRYSLDKADKGNELDLCILLNGFPIITAELKNEGTGQNYTNGIWQYRNHRDPKNPMLRSALVHFVVDNNYAFMTTYLNGEDTAFLPFNVDSVNPQVEGDYATSYLWRDIWQADSLLNIIDHFIKNVQSDGKSVTYFPRYHQLRVVRNLIRWVGEDGPGHNYLIEHSAGSGKTKSMAWLAHQLVNLVNPDQTPVFDSIIMVTDRIVLNANMADDVNAFATEAGVVKDIRRGSKRLAKAINEGGRIIVSTVQKFSYALSELKREKHRNYAVIIDEAHTAIGNESAKDIVAALSTEADIQVAMIQADADGYEDQMDALMAYMQTQRQQMSHISYFAFTATPKDKTYALFGKKTPEGYVAHDYYTMKQAIDEKFILDVLRNYTTYKTMFEYIEKNTAHPTMAMTTEGVAKEPEELYGEKKSVALILRKLNSEPENMTLKARLALSYFMQHTRNKIGGKAKAMFVSDSRASAVRYKKIFDNLLAEEYGSEFKTLVAFSGEVELPDGSKYTEDKMNGWGIKDDKIRETFDTPEYRILIVADKFQTGFDQPLLHTMFVDKMLGGIQCIQTLSRLNRCYDKGGVKKEDTMVIDFRNDADSVQKAFQKYYQTTILNGEVDTQRLYTLLDDIKAFKLYNDTERDRVVESMMRQDVASAVSLCNSIVKERETPLSNDDKDKYRKLVNRYIRSYGFMAQLLTYCDPDLEREYIFLRALYPRLQYTRETLPMEILDRVDLNKLRLQMVMDGTITLEEEDAELKSSRIGDVKAPAEDEKRSLREILDIVNEPYKGFLDDHDIVLRPLNHLMLTDEKINEAVRSGNSYGVLRELFSERAQDLVLDMSGKGIDLYEEFINDTPFAREYIRGLLDMALRNNQQSSINLDLHRLAEKIVEEIREEFIELAQTSRRLDEVAEYLINVIQKRAAKPGLNGANDLLINSFNHLLCNERLTELDRRAHFNTLVGKFESFLKKLYYLINNRELTTREGSADSTTFSDCIFGHESLKRLKHTTDTRYYRFRDYLEKVRGWRNDEAHSAPEIPDAELREAVHVLVTMYAYVIARSITDLEMNGF
ncbi:MAG: DEAD/DEAH box helicase family protein [Prevotella sp.]|jgi:type I restriction enzyme R subunit|uniref:type I restriction endonuclease subunit R n=2 Tax=Bacteroidales TaxID=171549 RepID=UPI000F485765|nr:DEAD/DEAH box helicase family protein [Muribaculum intestinale]MCX4294443.1 DEAD/DEAH box helicase family protein [Prevotella sp.]ROT17625.1 type I restriction endonuclease subunit R [Muribaculaceae bacterium Isolate-110 (HZI)]